MALDPRDEVRGSGHGQEQKMKKEIAELRRQLEDLRRGQRVFVTNGAPGIAAPVGAFAVDPAASNLWVSQGGGVWKRANLV